MTSSSDTEAEKTKASVSMTYALCLILDDNSRNMATGVRENLSQENDDLKPIKSDVELQEIFRKLQVHHRM